MNENSMRSTLFHITIKAILSLILISVFSTSFAQIKLPQLISDGVVLQRNVENNIWGWAPPGEKVVLDFNLLVSG